MRSHLAEHLAGDVDALGFALERSEDDGRASERFIPLNADGDRAGHVLLTRHARTPGLRKSHPTAEINALVAELGSLTSAMQPTTPGHRRFAKRTVDLGSRAWYFETKGK